MEIKLKDKLLKLSIENVNIDFQIKEDSSFTIVSSNNEFISPGEYEFDGLHTELLSSTGLDFKKIYISSVLTKNNIRISFVSIKAKLEKENITMLANSDLIIASTEIIVNNENSFTKINPFYFIGLSAKDYDEKYIKLFSVEENIVNNQIKIDEKTFNQDSDYVTKYMLIN